jgi:hypothetical protein
MSYYTRRHPKPISGKEQLERRLLAAEILSTLEENGFSRCKRLETKYGDNSEVVYAKQVAENKRYVIAVYTSCNQIGGAFIARQKGKDAIRVSGLYIKKDGNTRGIIKNRRVNRTGTASDICKRMIKRITSSFLEVNNNNIQACTKCGSPMFLSSKNNLVCTEICWRK